MSEIKFRGQMVNFERGWLTGYFFKHGEKTYIAQTGTSESGKVVVGWEEVDPETVGQYTGLKDKNGVEIYEGDFVKWDDGASIDEIRFERIGYDSGVGYTGFVGVDANWGEEWSKENDAGIEFYTCARGIKDKHLEVIGNKWDNPELLKRR